MSENRKTKTIALMILAFASLTLVLVSLAFDRGVAVMMHYTCPMVFAFFGMTTLSGRCRGRIDLKVGMAFVGWYVLSRILMKELYLDYSFSMFSNLCCAYLLAFPFACAMEDGQKKSGLKTATAIFVAGYAALAWIGVAGTVLGEDITLPVLNTQIVRDPRDLRLMAGNNSNISACMFMIAVMLGVWLLTQTRRRWLAVLLVLACLGAYTGIALADSRTALLQVGWFAAGLAFAGALHLPVKAMWKRAAIGLVAGILCLVIVFAGFGWAKACVSQLALQITAHAEETDRVIVADRGLFSRLTTMTGRTTVYHNVLKMIQDHPQILLTGLLNSDIVQMLREYSNADHTHNSFLQVLVNMGLPGLLMAVFFTVRAVWVSIRLIFSRKAAFADQILAVILLTFLLGTIPEPFLFTEYLTIANMPFFLVFGYALEAERALRV